MVDYLVSSCGLSSAEALRASEPLAHLKSSDRPDAVFRLLRQEGLGDAYIRRVVLRLPKVLLADAKKTMEPYSRSEIAQLISTSPKVFFSRDVVHRVEFWRKLVGTNQNVLKTLKREPSILCYRLDGRVSDQYGRSRQQDGDARADEAQALSSVSTLSRSTFDAKTKLLRSFGWTQAEFISAIQRFPTILSYSEKKINAVMDFLLNEAWREPSYIACHPTVVGYSMENRLIPRFYVLRSLKVKGLLSGSKRFSIAMQITEHDFIHKYIVPYSDELPELLEAYRAVLAKKAKAEIDSL